MLGKRKVRQGKVVSNKMDKTVVVVVEERLRHPRYKKVIRRLTKFMVHDKDNSCQMGDLVKIEETRPLSRTKRWRVVGILSPASPGEREAKSREPEAIEEAAL